MQIQQTKASIPPHSSENKRVEVTINGRVRIFNVRIIKCLNHIQYRYYPRDIIWGMESVLGNLAVESSIIARFASVELSMIREPTVQLNIEERITLSLAGISTLNTINIFFKSFKHYLDTSGYYRRAIMLSFDCVSCDTISELISLIEYLHSNGG